MGTEESVSPKASTWQNFAGIVLLIVFSGGVLLYLGTLVVQVIHWLRSDEWIQFPVSYFLDLLDISHSTLHRKSGWLGLKSMLAFVVEQDAGFVLMCLGLSPLIVAFIIDNYRGKA